MLGIPVHNRRRLIGAMVLEYPTREMLDEEHLARLCDRLQLDRQVMTTYARQACRHSAAEAPNLHKMFTMLLEDRQQNQEANQALTSLSMNLASTYEELSLLYRISGSMRVSQEPGRFLQEVCDQLLDVMNLDMSAAVMLDAGTNLNYDSVIKAGLESVSPQQIRLLVATHITPNLRDENDVLLENRFDGGGDVFFGKEVRNILAVPLITDRRIIGVLLGLNKDDGDFDSFDAKLIGSIANQTSVFLTNHRMYAEVQDLLMGVLHSLTESIDAKDPYTCGHSRRVAEISRRLAEGCEFPPERVQNIYLAGLLHDVGKIGVPEAILCKEGQ
ncbi:MAG: GAF domain-containing protein, partial [Candidatus Hydrogenedentes bacterium]|nr:GAF domain-containing protein [Candidatus Hydrogenedentota bacterium]